MPAVHIKLNVTLSESETQALATELARAIGDAYARRCPRSLVSIDFGPIFVDGSASPAAWVVVRSAADLGSAEFGLEAKRGLCRRFCEILMRCCAVVPGRVFFLVSRVSPEDAWNGSEAGPVCVADRKSVEPPIVLAEAQ